MSLSNRTNNSSYIDLSDNLDEIHEKDDTFEPHRVLESIEISTKKQKKNLGRRQLAQILHEQADLLQLKGDYETALIVYHRAATIYPRDISHNIAVRNTSATIHSATNPRGTLRELMQQAKNSISLMSTLSPETAARQAQQTLHYSKNPYEDIEKVLRYIDTRDVIDGKIHSKKRNVKQIAGSKMMLGQINSVVASKLFKMKQYFSAGDWKSTLNIGSELPIIFKAHEDNYCYRVAVHRYMALSHLYLGRHDRAVSEVAQMIQAAKKSEDEKLISRSFAVLGIVHLKFAHLNAAARAWQRLSNDVNRPILKAWLHHEIGRCYFEMSDYSKALEMSRRCIESSNVAKSKKWMCYGKLLNGQSLVKLGRLGESMEILEFVAETANDEIMDTVMVNYVQNLFMSVAKVLQKKSDGNIQKNILDVNTSTSLEGSNGNFGRSNENMSIPWLTKSSKNTDCVDISLKVLSFDNKEQENHLHIMRAVTDNSIVNEGKPKEKSCRVIDKWKDAFCNGKHFSQSKLNFASAPSSDAITLNGDMSARTQILRPIGDTPRIDEWTPGLVKSKKSCSTKKYIGNDCKKYPSRLLKN